MTTVYKFQCQFTKSKVGVTPANAPTVKIADRSNNLLVNGSLATALSVLPGVYIYNYTGADNLDLIADFFTADNTVDSQDLPSYTPYEMTVTVPSINAKTTNLPSDPASNTNVLTRLAPTVAGRTLDVTATGAAGLDWGNLENPDATNDLSGTTIDVSGINVYVAVSSAVANGVSTGQVVITSNNSFAQAPKSNTTADLTLAADIKMAVKENEDDDDEDSVLLISKSVGLERINGVVGTAGNATLGLTGTPGDWHFPTTLKAVEAAKLSPKNTYYCEYKVIWADGTTLVVFGGQDGPGAKIARGIIQTIT